VVYAGDLNGNLWKFVYDSSLGEWTLGNDGDPLFTTLAGQSITSQPKVAPLPNQGGVLVYFGTGSYLSTGDLTDTHTQSFYAIWDKDGVTGTVSRAALQGYKVHITTTISGYTVRTTTSQTDQASIDWNSQRGWYLDLPASTNGAPSERIIATPLLMQFTGATPSRVLFVTNTPASDPCSRGGTTWLMELDLYSGTATPTSVFDFNNDSKFDINDTIGTDQTPASGVALSTSFGLTGDPLLLNTNDGQIVKEFAGTTGHSGVGGPGQQGQAPGGSAQRIYWKQIH
jgi:type IV pilus assembly protein PilY1